MSVENGLWITNRSSEIDMQQIVQTTRIGINDGKDLCWRWYLKNSRSVSKRAKGDRIPKRGNEWNPISKTPQ